MEPPTEEKYSDFLSSEEQSDDETVAEIDVFLSRRFEEELFLVQFPTIPKTTSEKVFNVAGAAIQQQNRNLRVTVETKGFKETYEDAEEVVEVAEEMEEGGDLTFNTVGQRDINKLRMKSQQLLTVTKDTTPNYAVGYFDEAGSALHLSPITGALSMVPDLSQLDEESDGRQGSGKDAMEVDLKTERAKPIEVYQLRKETERAADYRKRSFRYIKEIETSEPWIDLEIRKRDHQRSVDVLSCHRTSVSNGGFGENKRTYLNRLSSG